MSIPPSLSVPAQISIGALVLLGTLGGSMIVAHSGFETSPRRGGASTFVPVPEAYILSAFMYLMSAIALVVLLRNRQIPPRATAVALCWYAAASALLVVLLSPE